MRPIDADKILKIHELETKLIGKDWTIDDLIATIEYAPTLEVMPVVHARWRKLKDDTEECTNCLGLCPHEENYNGDVIFNFGCEYCPWCGAKMDGDEYGAD